MFLYRSVEGRRGSAGPRRAEIAGRLYLVYGEQSFGGRGATSVQTAGCRRASLRFRIATATRPCRAAIDCGVCPRLPLHGPRRREAQRWEPGERMQRCRLRGTGGVSPLSGQKRGVRFTRFLRDATSYGALVHEWYVRRLNAPGSWSRPTVPGGQQPGSSHRPVLDSWRRESCT